MKCKHIHCFVMCLRLFLLWVTTWMLSATLASVEPTFGKISANFSWASTLSSELPVESLT